MSNLKIADWLDFKPYTNHSKIDNQYLTIANQLNKELQSFIFLKNEIGLKETDLNKLSIFLTCYLEDLVSDTNIWNAFVSIHLKKYKKELPFYSTKNYIIGEVNKIDIQFLIWYFLNLNNMERFLSPYDNYLDLIAQSLFEILDYEFDYVDENTILKDFYELPPNPDFYQTRSLIQKILFETYLFKIDSGTNLKNQIHEILKNTRNDSNDTARIINSKTDEFTHSYKTKLLALTGKEWLAEIIGNENKKYAVIKNISEKISSWFLYKGENNDVFHFQHVASDVIFDLTKDSFEVNFELTDNYIYYIEMVRWNNEWTFSGITFQAPFDANLILDEKNDMLKINIGTQYDENIKIETQKALKLQENLFIKKFKTHILFLDANDLQKTIDSFMDFNNVSLSKNEKDKNKKIDESKQRQREKGYFGEESKIEIIENGNLVLFYNPNSGIEIFNDIADIFPDKNNPYYKVEDVNKIKMFLFSPIYSKELTEFYIENYSNKLNFFKTGTGKKYLKDFDFLLRFWKKENYHTLPSITLL